MGSSQSSEQSVVAQPARHFHVPYERNSHYVDREGIIRSLKERLCSAGAVANSRMVVLHGRAGTGKTQCALELCWRLRLETSHSNIFWVSGDKAWFPNDFSSITDAIAPGATKHSTVEFLQTVKAFLESVRAISPWILVVDGVDMADFPYFPLLPRSGGNILFTSITGELPVQSGILFDSFCVGKMSESEAAQLLSTSALAAHGREKIACQTLLRELEYYPAYIARAATFLRHARLPDASASWYLSEYMALKGTKDEPTLAPQSESEAQAQDLDDMPEATWLITVNYLAKAEPAAFTLLQVASCLDPHCIQISLFHLQDRIDLHPHFKHLFDEQLLRLGTCEADLLKAFNCLVKFCLITRSPDHKYFQLQRAVREQTLKHVRSDKSGISFTNAVLLVSLSCSALSLNNAGIFASLLPHIQALTSLRHELCPELSKCLLLEIRLHAIRALRLQGRAPEAVSMAQEAVGRELVPLGTSPATDLLTLEWWHNLSMSLYDIDKFEEASFAGDLVYQNRLRLFGEGHLDTLRSLAHLGWVELSSNGGIQKAIQNWEKVLSQVETDEDLKQLEVDSRRGLAVAHGRLGNVDEALANQVRILDLQKSEYGEDSTQYLLVLLDAADFYFMKLGQHEKAGTILEDILPGLANDLGPAHPQVLAGYYRLGHYYLDKRTDKIDQAVLIFRNLVNTAATHILRAGLDPIDMCDGLADALKAEGTPEALEEALKLSQAVVTGFTNHKGQNHPRTQQAIDDLDSIQKLYEDTKRNVATQNTLPVEHATDTPTPPESLYQYVPLPKPSAYRVLLYEVRDSVIHCSLHTVDDTSTDIYSALSYTWASARPGDGLNAELTCKIICEGRELYITQNLFDALSTLRIQPKTFLWVDAICINQNDLEERSSQVAMMGSIYARARYTIVWLGKPDHCSRVVYGLLQTLAPTVDSLVSDHGADGLPKDPVSSAFWTKIGRQPFTPSEQMALVSFFDRYWFERCWIVQEVVLAKGVFCVCGGAEFKWTSLCNFSLYLLRGGWVQTLSSLKATSTARTTRLEAAPPVGYQPMSLTGLAFQCAQGLPVGSKETLDPANQLRADEVKTVFYRVLQYLVHRSRTSNATAPQDKVFAPAALALQLFSGVADPGLFTISYQETVQETFIRASKLIMQNTQSLSLLTKVEDRSFRHISDLPSWVPDFSVPFVQPLDLLEQNSFDCSAGFENPCNPKFHQQTLEVQGARIDSVCKTGPGRKESSIEARPSSWLDFLVHLDSQYVTGESSLEAFVRTLIADQRASFMTGDELVEAFHGYLLQLCAQSHELEQRIAAAAAAAAASPESSGDGGNGPLSWPVLDALEASAEKCSGIPTLGEVLQYRFDVSASKTKEVELQVYNAKRYFENAHYRVLLGRRLFQSQKGYIGRCPHSAREGDTIWIMPGCVAPIVLRQISGSTQSNVFELVGHCYVHGIMYGELLAAGRMGNLGDKSDGKDDLQIQSVVLK